MSKGFLIGMFILCFGLSIGYEVMAAPYNTRLDPGDRRGPPDGVVCRCHGHEGCIEGVTMKSELTGHSYSWVDPTTCEERKSRMEAYYRDREERKKTHWFYKHFN